MHGLIEIQDIVVINNDCGILCWLRLLFWKLEYEIVVVNVMIVMFVKLYKHELNRNMW